MTNINQIKQEFYKGTHFILGGALVNSYISAGMKKPIADGLIELTQEEIWKVISTQLASEYQRGVESKVTEDTSDGYHTFKELYRYRMLYNAAFFNELAMNGEDVCKSLRHSDGELCFGGGWFVVMAELPSGQISNHYEMKDWDLFHVNILKIAPKWDGHTPQEAADRLERFLRGGAKPSEEVSHAD